MIHFIYHFISLQMLNPKFNEEMIFSKKDTWEKKNRVLLRVSPVFHAKKHSDFFPSIYLLELPPKKKFVGDWMWVLHAYG